MATIMESFPLSGLDVNYNFLVVAKGDANTFLHDYGNIKLAIPNQAISVIDFTDDFKNRSMDAFWRKYPQLFITSLEQDAVELMAFAKRVGTGNVRGIIVGANSPGRYTLQFPVGAPPLTIEVVDEVVVSLNLRFLKYTGQALKEGFGYSTGTKRNVGDANQIIGMLNDVFSPQANISFVLKSAQNINVNDPLSKTVNKEFIMKTGIDDIKLTADISILFVEDFADKSSEAAGYHHGDPGVRYSWCVIPDVQSGSIPVVPGVDRFQDMLAHEVGHALGATHMAELDVNDPKYDKDHPLKYHNPGYDPTYPKIAPDQLAALKSEGLRITKPIYDELVRWT